jgi:hypothetical protein
MTVRLHIFDCSPALIDVIAPARRLANPSHLFQFQFE